jgi:formylglycine-generating enzyme required for sulfatase activity
MVAAAVLAVPLALPATAGCPSGMSRIGDQFCIDRYEASLVETLAGGGERAWSPYHTPEHARVRAVSRGGVVPQAYISQQMAERACRASGRRLCSNHEWLTACRGPNGTQFPYGSHRERGRCNENHGRHPVVYLFGHTRHYIWDAIHMNDPQINQLPGTLALTGAFNGCTNEYGVYDMVGNLHEWTNDPEGTFRGGYYMDTRLNGDGCSYGTFAHDTSYHDYSTGFRCCADLPGSN